MFFLSPMNIFPFVYAQRKCCSGLPPCRCQGSQCGFSPGCGQSKDVAQSIKPPEKLIFAVHFIKTVFFSPANMKRFRLAKHFFN